MLGSDIYGLLVHTLQEMIQLCLADCAPFYRVDISKQNPEKVFVFGGGGAIRSWDGGYTFPLDSIICCKFYSHRISRF